MCVCVCSADTLKPLRSKLAEIPRQHQRPEADSVASVPGLRSAEGSDEPPPAVQRLGCGMLCLDEHPRVPVVGVNMG